jgi:SAM-dependent methyltransferase
MKFIKSLPVVGKIAVSVKALLYPQSKFTTSEAYWIQRYKRGGNSGPGSYNKLAEFKGEVIKAFVKKYKIRTVIDLGCGDGNQLEYFDFPSYIGFDISPEIVSKCRERFKDDETKQFFLLNEISDQRADLLLSLDVLFHLVEDDVYHDYMNQLFERADSYVMIYSYDEDSADYAEHIRARKFSRWIEAYQKDFRLVEYIPNKYPLRKGKTDTTFSDFYIYKRTKI